MDKIKFSIIIPAYNVEKYVSFCLDSILKQKYENFEVLLIDDGSTDNTYKICEAYEEKNSKIRLYKKKNSGLSDTRNYGIRKAKGEYIIFVDSDDYIHENSLENISRSLKSNPDIVITRLVKFTENNFKECDKKIDKLNLLNLNKSEAINWVFKESENTWPSTKYIVSTKFIKKFNLEFKVGYLHEDIDWTTNLFFYGETFSVMKEIWYFHRINRKDSITTTSNYKRAIDVIEIVSSNINDKKYDSFNNINKTIIFERLLSSLYAILSQYKSSNNREKMEIIKVVEKNKSLLKYHTKFKYKVFFILVKFLGVKTSLDLISLF